MKLVGRQAVARGHRVGDLSRGIGPDVRYTVDVDVKHYFQYRPEPESQKRSPSTTVAKSELAAADPAPYR